MIDYIFIDIIVFIIIIAIQVISLYFLIMLIKCVFSMITFNVRVVNDKKE